MFDDIQEQLNELDTGSSQVAWRPPKGESVVRVLAGGTPIAEHWIDSPKRHSVVCYGISKGCPYHTATDKKPRIKHLFYILDKEKNASKVQLAELPFTVYKAIKAYSENKVWKFTSLPMPYDITITYNPDESPADMYKVMGSPEREAVSQSVLDELATKKPIPEIVEERKAKSEAKDNTESIVSLDDDDEVRPEDIPF